MGILLLLTGYNHIKFKVCMGAYDMKLKIDCFGGKIGFMLRKMFPRLCGDSYLLLSSEAYIFFAGVIYLIYI